MHRRTVRSAAVLTAAALAAVATGTVAAADDHLFNGATSPGAAQRGFTNPVVGNPSGVSGPAAQPGTVPGLGNPDAGADRGTPSVNLETLLDRLDDRSNGRGPSVG